MTSTSKSDIGIDPHDSLTITSNDVGTKFALTLICKPNLNIPDPNPNPNIPNL